MSGLSGGDRTWIILRGPNGGKPFWLSGTPRKGKQGVELARGIVGLDRPPTEQVWLQEAHQNGADLVGSNIDVRTISAAVNILGNSPRSLRDAYNRWADANFHDRYSRLFFINSYSGVRFLDVLLGESPSGSLDTDPALLRRIVDYPYKWVCPNPFYKGYTEEFKGKVGPSNTAGKAELRIRARNFGNAPRVYPRIFLPGPGVWEIPRGTRGDGPQGEPGLGDLDLTDMIPLPALKSDEGIWLNPDPRVETITKSVVGQAGETNLWAKMAGQRPRLWMNPRTSEEWLFRVTGGAVGREVKMLVQPLYNSFM